MLEKFYNYFVKVIFSFLSLLKVVIRSNWLLRSAKKESPSSIIILGTGPSLKDTIAKHLDILKGEKTMGLNHFADYEEYEIIKPSYYMVGAPELWNVNLDEYYTNKAKKLFKNISEKTTWPLELLIDTSARKSPYLKKLENNQFINIEFHNRTPIEGLESISHLLFKLQLGMPRPHNVLIPSIMVSIWKRINEIYIVGADHSWHEQLTVNDNIALINQEHYFDKKANWKPMKKEGLRNRFIHEIFEKWMLAFKGYHLINKYANSIKVKIYNASEKSYIDGFERASLTKIHEGL